MRSGRRGGDEQVRAEERRSRIVKEQQRERERRIRRGAGERSRKEK